MNYKTKIEEQKRIRDLFLTSSPEGTLKWSNESLEHFLVKAQVLFWLKLNNYSVWCEPVLKGLKSRPDLICLHNSGVSAYCIEIKKSELESSLNNKSSVYPLPVRVVNCKNFDYTKFYL